MPALLAIERHRLLYGDYPAKLEALVPQLLPDLPVDPWTGDAMLYRRIGDNPDGRTFVLYSVGPNRSDDGGVLDAPAGRRTSGRRAENPDMIFNAEPQDLSTLPR